MYIEPDIWELYTQAEKFSHSQIRDFPEVRRLSARSGAAADEIQKLLGPEHQYLWENYFCDHTMVGLFRALHWFRQGVLMARKKDRGC